MRAATAHAAVGRDLRFDAPAVVSREFRCVSTLPLWFRANSVAFRCSRCGFARIPASSGVFWPLLQGGRLGCGPQRRTRWGGAFVSTLGANSIAFRRSRCGFARIPLRFDAPALPLRFDAPAVVSREFRCVATLTLWFHANSVAFRCSRCGFARIPASSGVFWLLLGGRL